MKPLALGIQAFGPFSGHEEVDFTAFGENALFLINGPTGAGKSSLLDAICFALYGVTTGGEREASSMRSDQASEDLATEIRFDFQLGDQVYRIQRMPTQELTKKRGEGTTTRQTDAHAWRTPLAEWRGEFEEEAAEYLNLKGVREVNDWVVDLTGLSAEQFRQVMVLPQGKFRELLLASSSDRETIFSQLFQTHTYKVIEERLKEKAADIRREREQLTDGLAGMLSSVDAESTAELDEQIKELEPEVEAAKARLDETAAATTSAQRALDSSLELKSKFERLVALRKEQVQLAAEDEMISALEQGNRQALAAQKLQPVFEAHELGRQRQRQEAERLKALEAELDLLRQQQKEAEATLEKARQDGQQLDPLKDERTRLQGFQAQIEQLTRDRAQLDQASQRVTQAERDYAEFSHQRDSVKQQIQTLEAHQAQYQVELQPLADVQQKRADLERFGKLKRIWQDASDEAEQQEQVLAQLEPELKAVLQRQADLKEDWTRTEMHWHQGQAAELAAQLEAGQPCPVCGSPEHPAPARSQDQELVTRQDVTRAREQYETQTQTLTELQSRQAQLKQAIANARLRAEDQVPQLGEYARQSITELREAYQAANNQLERLKQVERHAAQAAEDLKNGRAQLSELDQREPEQRQRRELAIADRAAARQAVKTLEQSIPEELRDPKSLNDQLSALNQRIEAINKALEEAQQHHARLKEALAAQVASRNEVTARLDSAVREAEQKTGHWLSQLAASPFDDEAAFLRARLSDEEIEQRETRIRDHRRRQEQQNWQIKELSEALADRQEPDTEQLAQQLADARQQQEEASQAHGQFRSRLDARLNVSKRLAETRDRINRVDTQYGVFGTLADVAGGQNGSRISLQRFVLSVLLDDVLTEATHRLHVMSKGRYRLLRKLDRTKGNRASGLDLEVEDAYTGKARPVNTLSGGESFMAALALALGLSDVVQAYAGGIRLDTLFIDEGFGSLDPDSLDLAIQTLMELRANGRTVGIISHVSELKEQMPMRIDITASQSGSAIKVIA